MNIQADNLYKNYFAAAHVDTNLPAKHIPAGPQEQNKIDIKKDDEILASGFLSKQKYKIHAANTIPTYITKGLKGDPSSTFYEFIQICKVPYFIGGPVLAALFSAGANNLNYQSKFFAKQTTKKIAVGVGLYYIGVALAKAVIDIPVKLFRGVDLNLPYKKIVESKSPNSSVGYLKKTKEYHKVYESIDFTRWQLLHNYDNPDKPINYKYDKMAKKYGFDKPLNDSDSALRPYIQKTIVMSRAWKYILTIPFVALGLGLAKQKAWGDAFQNIGAAFKDIVSKSNKNLTIKERASRTKDLINYNLYKPFKESFKTLWKGESNSKISGKLGKAILLASILTPIYANYMILKKTSAKKDLANNQTDEQNDSLRSGANDK